MSNENDEVKIELDLPADLVDAVEARAAALGISTNEWMMDALRAFLPPLGGGDDGRS